jgi:hypothetical protein
MMVSYISIWLPSEPTHPRAIRIRAAGAALWHLFFCFRSTPEADVMAFASHAKSRPADYYTGGCDRHVGGCRRELVEQAPLVPQEALANRYQLPFSETDFRLGDHQELRRDRLRGEGDHGSAERYGEPMCRDDVRLTAPSGSLKGGAPLRGPGAAAMDRVMASAIAVPSALARQA